jgi:hypothetical protein
MSTAINSLKNRIEEIANGFEKAEDIAAGRAEIDSGTSSSPISLNFRGNTEHHFPIHGFPGLYNVRGSDKSRNKK